MSALLALSAMSAFSRGGAGDVGPAKGGSALTAFSC
jgi:hypothetical protein